MTDSDPTRRELPMFPLGSVLLPGMVLPLHVFEPRYLELVSDCMSVDRLFGSVLIERGSEVGGGDVRGVVGTVASIVQAEPFEAGRWGLVAVGTHRIIVDEWLTDAPYPRAIVRDWPDPEADPDVADLVVVATAALRRFLARAAELGFDAPDATFEAGTEPSGASFRLCELSPFGPADRARLLARPDPSSRLRTFTELLTEQSEMLDARARMLLYPPPDDQEE
jgi:Lon protease-like protein